MTTPERPPIEDQYSEHLDSEAEQFKSDHDYFHRYFSPVINEQLRLFEVEDGEVER